TLALAVLGTSAVGLLLFGSQAQASASTGYSPAPGSPSVPSLPCGSASFAPAQNYGAGGAPASVAVGDFNQDGIRDLAAANAGSNNVTILLGTGSGTFGAATNYEVGTNPYFVAVGDFNVDGKQDLALANATFISNNVSILLGTGTGSFGAATNFAVGT